MDGATSQFRREMFRCGFLNKFSAEFKILFDLKQITICGTNIIDIATLYKEINRVFMQNEDWKIGESLDAFNDLLYGGFGEISGNEPVQLIWENFEFNQNALGLQTTIGFYEKKLLQPEIFNASFSRKKLEELSNGNGQTYMEIILEIIGEHQNIILIKK